MENMINPSPYFLYPSNYNDKKWQLPNHQCICNIQVLPEEKTYTHAQLLFNQLFYNVNKNSCPV